MKIILIIATVFGILLFFVIKNVIDHPCIKSHRAYVHHYAYTQMLVTSMKPLMMVPIYHPGYDQWEEVCDLYK